MNEEKLAEQRNRSRRDFLKLVNTVYNSFGVAVKKGYHPTEVWLGEAEARIFMVELHWLSVWGKLTHASRVSEMINDNLDGVKLMGLRVRPMTGNGVRVGVSFSTEENT